MKKLVLACVAVWAAALLLPLLWTPEAAAEAPGSSPEPLSAVSPAPSLSPSPSPTPLPKSDREVSLTVRVEGETREMNLADYLLGVLCAEMPALYPEEALKAQAVAARTYYVYRMQGGAGQFDGADMTDDSTVCMAYREPTLMTASWGEETDAYTERMRSAVAATDGLILTDAAGKAIPAVFFAISSGKTESAADIWGSENPHLVSRDSSWDEGSPGFEATVTFPDADLRAKLSARYPEMILPTSGELFSDWARSAAGSVLTVRVAGVSVTGSELRSLLGLRSANFTVSHTDAGYVFTTRGYGHGIGMSQYGAKALASAGKTYAEILASYYTDATLRPMG